MSKPQKMLLATAIFLAASPLESAIILVGLSVRVIGIGISTITAFLIAQFIERLRRTRFFDINAALFDLCAYAPGLIASFVLCLVLINMPKSPQDNNGWGALALSAIGIFIFLSQLALTIMGSLLTLDAPKKSKLPRLPYRPDIPDPDSFFNDKKER